MTIRNEALPRFQRPPVIETVLGVHFRPLELFTSAHQGLLWERWFRDRFPRVDERPPVEEVRERFGSQQWEPSTIRWWVSDRPPTPRLWAASPDGERVIQIQKNGFFANWLKTSDHSSYRSYEERRQEFSRQFGQVEQFFQDEGIGQLLPTSWSATYINHIEYEEDCELGAAIARTLRGWPNPGADTWLPAADRMVLEIAFPMPHNAGRLNVSLRPAFVLKDERHVLRLDLTARGQLRTTDAKDALAGLELGHEWIVQGFASLTSPEMHQHWGRIQ